MLSIEGVQISPDHWEITIYGWYVTLRQSSENNLWNATIQSLVEQMPIISSGDYINLLEAKGWCIEEILRQWKKSFQQ